MGRDIGKKVRRLRIKGNMSQSQLAQKSGIAQSTLSYIESGKKVPQFDTLSSICKGLGISVLELLSYDEPKAKRKLFEQKTNIEYTVDVSTELVNLKDACNDTAIELYVYYRYINQNQQ